MLNLLRHLLPAPQLPPHLHIHIDDRGEEILCDESICRPQRPSHPLLFAPLR